MVRAAWQGQRGGGQSDHGENTAEGGIISAEGGSASEGGSEGGGSGKGVAEGVLTGLGQGSRSGQEPGSGSGQGSAIDKKYKSAKPHQGCGRQPEPVSKLRRQLRMGATSLIIACRQQPLPILVECLALLTPSSPFVVYFEYMEPLVECYLYVTEVRISNMNIFLACIIYIQLTQSQTPSFNPYSNNLSSPTPSTITT